MEFDSIDPLCFSGPNSKIAVFMCMYIYVCIYIYIYNIWTRLVRISDARLVTYSRRRPNLRMGGGGWAVLVHLQSKQRASAVVPRPKHAIVV